MNMILLRKTFLLLACGLFLVNVNAGSLSNRIAINFKGRVIMPPSCRVIAPQGGQIEVSFGKNVSVNKIDGVNYRQPLNYSVKCGAGDKGSLTLWLTMKGDIANFDATKSTLATNLDGMGIRIYQGGAPFVLNKPLAINSDKPPLLEAVPIKKSGVQLQEGAFEAIATLLAKYE